MNLAGHRHRRLPENYFEPCNSYIFAFSSHLIHSVKGIEKVISWHSCSKANSLNPGLV